MKPLKINYTRPFVFDYQRSFMDNPERFTITEASTKVGKTAGCVIWLFEQALLGRRGNRFWWVAPVFQQAKIAFERMKRQVSLPGFFKANESNLTLTLPNGAVIEFKSAEKPDSLYGEDVYAAVFDEFTRARESAWHALRSTLTSTKGKCKFIGNVRGRGWGYKLAQKAKNGTAPEYAYRKITCWDAVKAGRLPLEEVEQAKRDLPDHVFRELYEAEPSDDGGNPFGIQHLEACKVAGLAPGPALAFGIDLAKSVDYTVIIGLNEHKQVCFFDRFQLNWTVTAKAIDGLPDMPTLVDATGVGNPVVEEAQSKRRYTEGFTFTSGSKQMIVEALAIAIRRHEIAIPEGPLFDELLSFEYQYSATGVKYSAPVGLHDDCVMALALAYHKLRNMPNTAPPVAGRTPTKKGVF